MTPLFDFLDAPLPDLVRYALSAWFAAIAMYLAWCGRQLQAEQANTDRLAEALPPRLTCVELPPAPALEHPRQDSAGKQPTAGGIRIPLERVL